MKNRKLVLFVALVVLAAFTLVGCGDSNETGSNPAATDSADKGTVKLLYVQWSCATATTHVIGDILEHELGYDVELIDVTAAAMFEGLAAGEGDAVFCCWLPVTHGEYMNEVGDSVDNLGPNMHGAKIGLVVPEYVDIDSIEDLNSVKDKFNGKITGVDPGAGIMNCTNKALKDYALDYEIVEGSGATMTAALKQAIQKEEWIVVTGWTPHWKFARWDLKYLDDPKKLYGEDEEIDTVVRKGLKEDMPDVYEFFDKFAWTSDDLSAAMILAEDMGDSKAAAHKWVEENQELVKSWLPEK